MAPIGRDEDEMRNSYTRASVRLLRASLQGRAREREHKEERERERGRERERQQRLRVRVERGADLHPSKHIIVAPWSRATDGVGRDQGLRVHRIHERQLLNREKRDIVEVVEGNATTTTEVVVPSSFREMMLHHEQHQHQQQHPGDGEGAGAMDAMACDDHHVVVGRMDLAPQVQGLRMLNEQQEHEQQRILYGEKRLGDHDHDGMAKVQHPVQHPGHVVVYGDRGHDNGHEHSHAYGVEIGNGKHGVVDDMDAKLGGLGAAMLRVDAKMEGRERQMSEGDAGTANSPQVGKLRGRSSRDPAIEWSETATTVLLQAFGEKYRALDRGNFTSKIWADIAARVNSRGSLTGNLVDGIPKTQEQCRIKVDNLKKRYKVEREKKRVSGSVTSKWIFYDMMDELIGANPRHMRSGGGLGGADSPLGLENGGTPLGIRTPGEDGDRMYYLESAGGEGDQTSETIPKISPIQGRRKRKRALEDLEREHVNAPALMALFEGYNVPPIIIDAMLQEDMDEYTLINSRDITVLLDQLRSKHRLHIKLGPAERIKQAIEAAKEKKNSLALVIQQQQQ